MNNRGSPIHPTIKTSKRGRNTLPPPTPGAHTIPLVRRSAQNGSAFRIFVVMSILMRISSSRNLLLKRKRCNSWATISRTDTLACRMPMQFLGPPLNGRNDQGWRAAQRSGRKRSGSNSSAVGPQMRRSRFILSNSSRTTELAGMVVLPPWIWN